MAFAQEASNPVETVEQATWPRQIYNVLKRYDIRQVPYVPDGGHAELIQCCRDDKDICAISLTTEEEGVAVASGAWLGGQRAALLMQSSGVGNCINMLSLIKACKFPFLTLVTMRGEWNEFNPWQVPMGSSVRRAFELMDITVLRASSPDEAADTVTSAAQMSFVGGTPTAVLLSQRLVGAKLFVE